MTADARATPPEPRTTIYVHACAESSEEANSGDEFSHRTKHSKYTHAVHTHEKWTRNGRKNDQELSATCVKKRASGKA